MIRLLRIPFNIGTISGLALFACFLILQYLAVSPVMVGPFVLALPPMAAMLWASLRIKKEVLHGKITFRRVFFTGVITAFTSVSLGCILIYMFALVKLPELIDTYFNSMIWLEKMAKMEGQYVTDTFRQEQTALLTPRNIAFGIFQMVFFICNLVNLLFGLILQNQKWKPGVEYPDEPAGPHKF